MRPFGVLAELHLHFAGSVRPAAVLRQLARCDDAAINWDWYESEMVAAYGSVLPMRDVVARYRRGDAGAAAEFAELYVFGDRDAGNFARFQAKMNLLWVAESDDTTARFADAIRADHVRQGLGYAELRIDTGMMPAFRGGTDIERYAVTIRRDDPWPEWEMVRRMALGPHGHVVTGIDFCGVEEGYPPKDKAAFFAEVHEFNARHPDRAIAILYHVGESFLDKSLESAVRWVHEAAELGAHRLGHAIALGIHPDAFGVHTRTESVAERRDQIAYDLRHAEGLRAFGVDVDVAGLRAELDRLALVGTVTHRYDRARLAEFRRRQDFAMSRVRRSGAVIEVCPTSNRRIGDIRDPALHPVHRFLAAGLPVVISTDDPGIFGITLNDELDWVCTHTGGGAELRRELLDTAWRSRSEVLTGREKA
jgi:adenosine deaminase